MEEVILVDEQNNQIGTAPKNAVHTTNTPLHRAFSVFLFNSKKELLLTQRAKTKRTFPGVWTNTVCGHPSPGEETTSAAKRRLKDELGLSVTDIKEIVPYRYRFADDNGIIENEICPVFIAYSNEIPQPNPDEVEGWTWMQWQEFLDNIKINPSGFSPWSVEEALLIKKNLI